MASHVSGIAITIKAFLPTGKTLDEQFTALSLVKDAHASGDYSAVLKAAKIDEVKAEQKTRRVEDQPQAEPETVEASGSIDNDPDYTEPAGDIDSTEEVPEFIKAGRRKANAA